MTTRTNMAELLGTRGRRLSRVAADALATLPPTPEVPLVRAPKMPAAGDENLDLLRAAYVCAGRRAGVKSARVPHPESWGKTLTTRALECDGLLSAHKIPPHAWALYRIQGIMRYEAQVTLRAIWNPAKVSQGRQRGYFRKWWGSGYTPTRMATAHRDLLAAWELMIVEATREIGVTGALDPATLMERYFPYPATYARQLAHAINLAAQEQHHLERQVVRGEWVW